MMLELELELSTRVRSVQLEKSLAKFERPIVCQWFGTAIELIQRRELRVLSKSDKRVEDYALICG